MESRSWYEQEKELARIAQPSPELLAEVEAQKREMIARLEAVAALDKSVANITAKAVP